VSEQAANTRRRKGTEYRPFGAVGCPSFSMRAVTRTRYPCSSVPPMWNAHPAFLKSITPTSSSQPRNYASEYSSTMTDALGSTALGSVCVGRESLLQIFPASVSVRALPLLNPLSASRSQWTFSQFESTRTFSSSETASGRTSRTTLSTADPVLAEHSPMQDRHRKQRQPKLQ
jgi:hypothetical protein